MDSRTRTFRIGAAVRSATIRAMAIVWFLSASMSVAPRPARAAESIGIPDCLGVPRVRPTSIMLACGDGGLIANGLTWTGWGAGFAAARGTASANDCTPNCAEGHFHTSPVVLIADGRERCPDGRPAYARITVAWPAPAARSPQLAVPTPCGNR